jgi:hypothetical protein
MSLYDFFFSEEPHIKYLRTIAQETEQANRLRSDKTENLEWQNRQLHERIRRLEGDVGGLALIVASILKKLDEKGHVTRDEVKTVIEKLDLIDGIRDGKIGVSDLGSGDFFESS